MNRKEVRERLAEVQTRCRKRKLDIDEAWDGIKRASAFLVDAPPKTEVKCCLSGRLPSSYNYPADATFVRGKKDPDGNITVNVVRSQGGFGNREAIIHAPEGYIADGPKTHKASGSCDSLERAYIVSRE